MCTDPASPVLSKSSYCFYRQAGIANFVDQIMATGPDGVESPSNVRKPVVELIVDKNKISGFKGTTFFKMWPESGRLEECSPEDQSNYRAKVALLSAPTHPASACLNAANNSGNAAEADFISAIAKRSEKNNRGGTRS